MKIEFADRGIMDWYGKMKRMSYSQFLTKLHDFGAKSFEQGLREGEDEGTWWTDEQIYELLRAERIGPERARRIVEKLVEGER